MPAVQPYERMERYKKSQQDRGFVRVAVWVPAASSEALLAYAAKLRGKARKRGS